MPSDSRKAFFAALSAYLLWGFLPIYMKAIAHVPVAEVLAHRIVWSLPVSALILAFLGGFADLRKVFTNRRMLSFALLTSALISFNWAVYVYAITSDRALETALGYYINPLFSIFLGAVLLREKLSTLQWVAISFAVIAVAIVTWDSGGIPLVSLALAISWGFYALAKRTLPIGAAQGFFMEVLILAGPALAYLIYLYANNNLAFVETTPNALLLGSAGFVTAIPLTLYAIGGKGLRLSTIALMQYIAPSIIFLIAVFVFKEPFSPLRFLAFGFIWLGLLIYSLPMLKRAP